MHNEKACNCESIATRRPPNVAPVVLLLAHYQHFLGFPWLENIVFSYVFGGFRLRSIATTHVRETTATATQTSGGLHKHTDKTRVGIIILYGLDALFPLYNYS